MAEGFSVGQKVRARASVFGMQRGEQFEVAAVEQDRKSFLGMGLVYRLKAEGGRELKVPNADLVLEAVQ